MRLLALLFLVIAFFHFWHTPEMNKFTGRDLPGKQEAESRLPDRVGEQIAYDLYLGKVKLGHAKYHHLRTTKLNGRLVHLITFQTKAMRFHDRETIYCDTKTFLPILVERKVSQFIKPEKIIEEYDQENFTLTITKTRFTTEKHVIKKDGPIHNSILLPYVVRNSKNLEIGWSFDVNLPQRKYKITLAAIESLKVPAGEYLAYYFESEPKQIRIWISKDEHRLPLKIEGTGGMIGYKLLMREYSLPQQGVQNSK